MRAQLNVVTITYQPDAEGQRHQSAVESCDYDLPAWCWRSVTWERSWELWLWLTGLMLNVGDIRAQLRVVNMTYQPDSEGRRPESAVGSCDYDLPAWCWRSATSERSWELWLSLTSLMLKVSDLRAQLGVVTMTYQPNAKGRRPESAVGSCDYDLATWCWRSATSERSWELWLWLSSLMLKVGDLRAQLGVVTMTYRPDAEGQRHQSAVESCDYDLPAWC